MSVKLDLIKEVRKSLDCKDLSNRIALVLRSSMQNPPIESESHKVNGRCGFVGDLTCQEVMQDIGLIRLVYVEDEFNSRGDGCASYLILTRKAEKYFRRLEREGFYSEDS